MEKIFDIDKADFKDFQAIKADYISAKISLIGGRENASIILYLSMDKKESWINGIYHNSRYYIIDISINGDIEVYSRGQNTNKIRKCRKNSIPEAIEYINKNIEKIG